MSKSKFMVFKGYDIYIYIYIYEIRSQTHM
jgi:hypothetical protein